MDIELEHLINEYSELEDQFIIDAKLQIDSYEESIRKLYQNENSQKRITVYPEDTPLYKVSANTKY